MPKHKRYQDYVIKAGRLVGEFDEMYKDFQDPWEQSLCERGRTEKNIAIFLLERIKAKRVLELGCGLGYYTNEIQRHGFDVLGVDVSPIAIRKAKARFPKCRFQAGDILDRAIYAKYKPDAIIMAEISWYVLEKLDSFKRFLRENPSLYVIHLLNTYPKGVQKHGKEFFSNLPEILDFYRMNYLEYGEIHRSDCNGEVRTYFIGRYGPLK